MRILILRSAFHEVLSVLASHGFDVSSFSYEVSLTTVTKLWIELTEMAVWW